MKITTPTQWALMRKSRGYRLLATIRLNPDVIYLRHGYRMGSDLHILDIAVPLFQLMIYRSGWRTELARILWDMRKDMREHIKHLKHS